MNSTKRTRIARLLVGLASAATIATGTAGAQVGSDLGSLDRLIAKRVPDFDRPQLPCLCESGTTTDTKGVAGLLIRVPENTRFDSDGIIRTTVTVRCQISFFDTNGTKTGSVDCE